MKGQIDAVITPQILYEFYSVVTNPRRIDPPIQHAFASDICRTMQESPELGKVQPPSNVPLEVFKLTEEHSITGAGIFDCILAVTARENDIRVIYTQNVDDFNRFNFLTVENPLRCS